MALFLKHLNILLLNHKVGEFTFEPCSLDDVVVDPVIVSSSGFAHQQAMKFEIMPFQPLFCDLPVLLRPGGEEGYDVPIFVPLVEDLQSIPVGLACGHPLRLFVGDVIADGSVDVYEVILDLIGQDRT